MLVATTAHPSFAPPTPPMEQRNEQGDDGPAARVGGEAEGGVLPAPHVEQDDFLTLPAFRMMCLSNPLLDTFFSSQLPASFRVEAPHRASVNGTSIWHDVQSAAAVATGATAATAATTTAAPSPRLSQAPASAPATTASFSPPSSSRAYSKDVSTGVVGRLGGFLNTFLGDDVKAKVDDLADSLGEKLNTKVVRGPLPSFAHLDEGKGGNNEGSRRTKSSGTMGMDDLRAMEEQRREKRRLREKEEQEEEEGAAAAMAAAGATLAEDNATPAATRKSTGPLRGIDITAAQESLRMATEAVVEGTQTGGTQFGDDIPVLAGTEDDEEDDVVVDDDVVVLPKAT